MIDLRRFAQRILDAVRELVVGARQVERAAKRFRQWGARTCDNNSFPHGFPFRISVFIWMISHRAHRGHRGVTTPLCPLCALWLIFFIHLKNAVNHCLVTNRLRLFNRSTIASGAFSGEPASKGGCGSYSMLN